MNTRRFVIAIAILFQFVHIHRAHADEPDTSRAPYFFVEAQSGAASLALTDSKADISIAGVIADVVVTQAYKNDGQSPIDARYVFPASTRAAVYGMTMKVGNRTIKAKIKKRAEARADYEAAKREGKSASLLEQDRPNVFSMNVANILPGDNIEVELRYTELLIPEDGIYEMVYPTAVGPRYVGANADPSGAPDSATPFLKPGTPAPFNVSIAARISAGMPVYGIASPSHAITSSATANHDATIVLNEPPAGDRDFVLRYQLASTEVASGLMLYEGAKENFYLMMVQPPPRPKPEDIPAREYVFIIDVSGSMHGYPLDVTEKLMQELFATLGPKDRFNVMLFSGGASLMAETSLGATSENIDKAIAFVTSSPGAGGTRLLAALEQALRLPTSAELSRSFIVVTDGYISAERETFDFVRANLGRANVFAFGIGSSVNRHLIEGLATAGMGMPFVTTTELEAPLVAAKFRKYIESPVLTNMAVTVEGFETYDQQPAAIPDAFANRPVVVFGKWRGKPTGSVTLTGVSGKGRFVNTFDVSTVKRGSGPSALRYLWARSRIGDLSDFGSPSEADVDEITRLGIAYNLLTQYTSFIAIHDVARNTSGKAKHVNVAQPLPAGVDEHAFGITSGPEPEFFWLLGWMLLAFGVLSIRRRRARMEKP